MKRKGQNQDRPELYPLRPPAFFILLVAVFWMAMPSSVFAIIENIFNYGNSPDFGPHFGFSKNI